MKSILFDTEPLKASFHYSHVTEVWLAYAEKHPPESKLPHSNSGLLWILVALKQFDSIRSSDKQTVKFGWRNFSSLKRKSSDIE